MKPVFLNFLKGKGVEVAPQTVARILILSYFVGLALGLIGGTDLSKFTGPFLSDRVAIVLMGGLVLVLCGFVLFGFYRRPAALVLALILFWTSYMTMYQSGATDVGLFWRDLALIGGLLFSAGFGDSPGQDIDEEQVVETTSVIEDDRIEDVIVAQSVSETRPVSVATEFRRDFDLAQVT